MPEHELKICPRCHTSFECKVSLIHECQCADVSLTEDSNNYIQVHYQDCLCRTCLLAIQEGIHQESNTDQVPTPSDHHDHINISPVPDEDYYINEKGQWVFTRHYHLKRGYCCKSGCKHCPYGFIKAS